MRTSPVSASWAMAGTSPPALSKSIMTVRPQSVVLWRHYRLKLKEAENGVRHELLAAFEKRQLHQERATRHLTACFLDEPTARLHRAAGRQQIVHQQPVTARGH